MYELTSKLIKTDVTCVKCFHKYIFAGIGGNLHLFDQNGNLLQIYNVFPSQRIYGIIPNTTNSIVIFGGFKLKIIEFDFIKSRIANSICSKTCEDWILDVKWINNDENITILYANHYISNYTSKELKVLQNVACEQRCLLYSGLIIGDTWEDLFVFSGTIFSEILLWKPSEGPFFSPVSCALKGHDGVIFSINYNKDLNILITTSDDRTVRFWNAENIFSSSITQLSPVKSLYGHLARVFKSLVIDDKVISTGEDSNIFVWNLDGKLIQKYESHQNGCIWTIDKTSDGKLVSGGGDSGICIYPFNSDSKIEEINIRKDETPKIIKILSRGKIILINEKGVLKMYDEQIWRDFEVLDELKSYSIMEISSCRKYLALGGFSGAIFIYEEKEDGLLRVAFSISTNSSRIHSIHWLSSVLLLTSENNGKLQLWKFCKEENKLEPIEEFLLPPSKERWATSAVLFNGNLISVGDRKGNIHLYKFGKKEAIQSVKKAHSHLGITGLYFINDQLFTLGRNGILKKFTYSSENHLSQISNDKLPFSWLSQIISNNNLLLLLGFSGSNFIIYDHQNRRILHEINCGGGHRSWDFHITNNQINFIYLKEKILHTFNCNLEKILTRNIVDGYHCSEINALHMLAMNENNFLIVSGGEDTTLRLGHCNLRLESCFKGLEVFKSHLSSIRCVKLFPVDKHNYIMVSAGGRAQIIVWKIQFNDTSDVTCLESDSYYKCLDETESETRVMDLTLLEYENDKILVTACSDGTLHCFKLTSSHKLEFLCSFTYALKCIIKVEYVKICDRKVIISMATDGKLAFWDFTNIEKKIEPFYTLSVHQSGINSFSYKCLSNDTFLFVSGGDDNNLCLNIVNFNFTDKFDVKLVTKCNNAQLHAAQITGLNIFKDLIIATSIDQNISISEFKFDFKSNILDFRLKKFYSSVVADIQGMNCVNFKNDCYICVFGKGIEIVHLG